MKALFTLLALGTLASSAFAQGGMYPMSFQGKLVDAGGNPIDSAGISITFKLYKDNTAIWTETQSVDADSGVFNVYLGADTPLDTVAFAGPIELGIKLDGEASEMTPRTPLASAAFALGMRGMYGWYADVEPWTGYNIVGGSAVNSVSSGVIGATIAGGGATFLGVPQPNRIEDYFGFIGGGVSNTAAARYAVISGGANNKAIGESSTIGGGAGNIAVGEGSIIPGGEFNSARGRKSFAAGQYAKANHDGSFVWSDRSLLAQSDSLYSTGVNHFLIRAAGGVGIGTNAPQAQLHIQTSDLDVDNTETSDEGILLEAQDAILGLYSSNAGNWGSGISMAHMVNDTLRNKWAIIRETLNIGSDLHFKFGTSQSHQANDTRFEITNDGPVVSHGIRPFTDGVSSSGSASLRWLNVYTVNAPTVGSDRRLKQDIEEIKEGLSLINALRPVRYRWKAYPGEGPMMGLIAQEVEPYVPEAVRPPANDSEFYGMQYEQLIPVLIKAVQEQSELITRQSERIAALEARLIP